VTDRVDTPGRLVAAAEKLFAEGGEPATSLRAVARLAHANPAAVHYHFGGRDQLLRAVVDRHLGPVAERRRRLLDEAAQDDPPAAARVVEAIVRPDLELLAKLRKHRVEIARFLGREWLAAAPDDTPDRDRAVALVARGLPDVGRGELAVRLNLLRLTVAALFAGAAASPGPAPLGTADVDDQVRRLVAFAEAGLAAAPVTRSGKRRKR
jgi:AcrR family transcriptional regulator